MFKDMLKNGDIVIVDYFGFEQRGIVVDDFVFYFEKSSGFDKVNSLQKQDVKRIYRQNGKYGTNTDVLDLVYDNSKNIKKAQEYREKLEDLREKFDKLNAEISEIESKLEKLT